MIKIFSKASCMLSTGVQAQSYHTDLLHESCLDNGCTCYRNFGKHLQSLACSKLVVLFYLAVSRAIVF